MKASTDKVRKCLYYLICVYQETFCYLVIKNEEKAVLPPSNQIKAIPLCLYYEC
jgi:hypothetical protein